MTQIRPPSADQPSRERDGNRTIDQFAADAHYYLTQEPRQLPSRYLYDDLGSALFDAICHLPWYSITRAEHALLAEYGAEIAMRAAPTVVVELGTGNGDKLRRVLSATPASVHTVHVIDISPSALVAVRSTLKRFEHLDVRTYQAAYEEGLAQAAVTFRAQDRVLVLFLGSNLGNFDPPARDAFLRGVRRTLRAGDQLLLGVDLIKPVEVLRLAYDDPLGVTAAFNRNLLVRANRELAANFPIADFDHLVRWNAAERRIEMHLRSRERRTIVVPRAGLEFTIDADEAIWTESSYKFESSELTALVEAVGFRLVANWEEPRNRLLLTLAEAV